MAALSVSPLLHVQDVPSAGAGTGGGTDCGCRMAWQWERVADARVFTHSRFVSPRALLAFRCVYFVWQLCACVALGVKDWGPNADGLVIVVTLSYLSFCSIVLYFGVTIAFTLRHPALWKQSGQTIGYADDRADAAVSVGTGLRLLWVVFEVLVADSMVVTSVYWAVLHHGRGLSWQDFHMHTLNAIGMFTELWLNALPVAGAHAVFMLAFGVVYLCWSLGVHAVSHAFIYPFLDYTQHWWSALQYPAVLLYALLLFYAAVGLYRVREHSARRYAGADVPSAPGYQPYEHIAISGQQPLGLGVIDSPAHRLSVDPPRLTDDTGLTDAAALRGGVAGSLSRSSHPALHGDNAL